MQKSEQPQKQQENGPNRNKNVENEKKKKKRNRKSKENTVSPLWFVYVCCFFYVSQAALEHFMLGTPRQAGHASTSTSLDMASKAKASATGTVLRSCVIQHAYKPSNFSGIHSESGKLRSHCSHCSESQVCLCCVEPLWETVPALKTQLSRMTFLFLLQPANTKLADTTHTSVLQSNTLPNTTVPASNGCPLQQWTEGQPLPVQSIHERYNAINCMCCLKLLETPRQAGHASTSTSLDKTSRAKAYTADACLEFFKSSCWYFPCAFSD